MSLSRGKVTLQIHNPANARYHVQFSTNAADWKTLDANQKGGVWTGADPGGERGYFRIVQP